MTFFVRIESATGAVDGWGEVPADQVSSQARDGMIVLAGTPDCVTREVENGRTVIAVDQAWMRQALADKVDAEAEQLRLRFITPGVGQAMVYMRKEREARAWLAATAPQAADYPMLAAEAAATGYAIAALAALVVAQAEAWALIGGAIEGARLSAKIGIRDGTTIPAVLTAAQVDWVALAAGFEL